MLETMPVRPAADDDLAVDLSHILKREGGPAATIDRNIAFVVCSLNDDAGASYRAAEAHREGLTVCHVGYDAACVLIGPVVVPGGTPCLQCARLWAPGLNRGHRTPPLPAPLIDLVAAQIVAYVTAWRIEATAGSLAKLWWIDVDTLARSVHRLSPNPECDRCRPGRFDTGPFMAEDRRVGTATWRERDRPDGAILVERLVDTRFGLVRRFERETEAIAHPMTFAAFVGRGDPRQLEIGVGRSGCQAVDRDVAVLEALERFSGFRPRGKIETVAARYNDIALVAIDPRAFILPSAEQCEEPGFALAAFDPEAVHEWTWAFSFRRGSRMLIPLQFAYYDLPAARLPRDKRFVLETSNGCALGSSVEEAALFGLFEVLERDAYLTTWYGRLVPVRLSVETIDDFHIAGMIARIEAAGFAVSILDVGVGLPIAAVAVLAVDRRTDAPVASHVSTGAHLDAVEALRGALVEVCTRIQHRPARIVAESHARGAAMLRDGSLVRGMDDHATLYAHADSLPRLDFLTASQTMRNLTPGIQRGAASTGTASLNEALRSLADRVLDVAEDVLVADLSNTLTGSVGLRCVKVLAPGLLPVTFGHQHRRVSAMRIAEAAAMTGRTQGGDSACPPHNFQ